MAAKKYIPNTNLNYFTVLHRELSLMRRESSCFLCKIRGSELVCVGNIKPTFLSINYDLKIIYRPPEVPKVYVVKPNIEYSPTIHMYKDKSLCLYYPKEMPWDFNHSHLSRTIINWTAEWLVFYELYQISGKWEGKSISHT